MVATKRKIVPLFSGLLVSGLVFGLNVNVSGAADNGSVAQLEAQLAKQTTEAQNALIQVQVMGEKANTARESARTASAKAEKARKDAQEANGKLEDARKSLAGISTTVYRQNGSLSSLAPYLEADGLETVEMKRVAVELFGTKASKKMQSYSALKEVAGVIEQRADKAEQAAKASAAAADRSLNAAQATADAAQRQVQEFQNKRNEIIANLAKARGTDVATETANQNARAAQRIARENNAAADRLGVPKSERPSASAVARSGGSVVEPVLRPPAAPRPAPTPAPRPAPKPAPAPRPAPKPAPAPSANRAAAAVAYARKMIGTPYVWAGETPHRALDCSGLTMVAWAAGGVNLPHQSEAQFNVGTHLPLSQMRPGDLLFWNFGGGISHVAIYTGNGMMVEAPYPGTTVRETAVYYGGLVNQVVRL